MKKRKKRTFYAILGIMSAFLALLLYLAPHTKALPELVIYDIHPEGPRIVKDDGTIEFSDYVRIRNLTDHTYDLTGLFLSDSRGDLRKLPLDGVVINSGDSVMIKLDPSWNFALKSSGGESVYLSDGRGNILYRYSPAMKPSDPVLSAESGFYENEFSLTMSAVGNTVIHYTLDGSEPDEDSPVYSEPIRVYDRSGEPNRVVNIPNIVENYLEEEVDGKKIEQPIEAPVDKAFIIRAVSMDMYGNKSDIVTKEYFFCKDKYRNVMSVVADPEDLFGDYGILSVGKEYDEWYLGGGTEDKPDCNYKKKGRDWEIPADMAYFKSDREVVDQKCGLKLHGRMTRERRIKNFQLRARDNYSGSDILEYDFFDNEKYRSDAVILDDSFRESLFYSLVDVETITKQKTTDRVALFLNGEFWNNVYIRQKLDERYFYDHYGVESDNLILYNESFPEIGGDNDDLMEADRSLYLALDEFAKNNDLTIDSNYKKIQTMMDFDTYIDYLAINIWAGCGDWGEYENDMYWRVREMDNSPYGDGRFRWVLHDGDYAFSVNIKGIDDCVSLEKSDLYRGLMSNRNFRNRLYERLTKLGETTFSDSSINKELTSGKWDEAEMKEIEAFLASRKETIDKIISDETL